MATAPRPKNIRRDPTRRKQFTGYDPTKLLQGDPTKKYKFVDPSAKLDGVGMHESRGWEIVLRSKDGPCLQIGTEAKMAEPVSYEQMVLMSIDRAEWDRVEQQGSHGQGGQDILDAIDDQITNPGGFTDIQGGDIADVRNETSRARSYNAAAI